MDGPRRPRRRPLPPHARGPWAGAWRWRRASPPGRCGRARRHPCARAHRAARARLARDARRGSGSFTRLSTAAETSHGHGVLPVSARMRLAAGRLSGQTPAQGLPRRPSGDQLGEGLIAHVGRVDAVSGSRLQPTTVHRCRGHRKGGEVRHTHPGCHSLEAPVERADVLVGGGLRTCWGMKPRSAACE